jgi:folate-binding protein YgfZ
MRLALVWRARALYLMAMAYASILEDRAVLALKGPDARDFLQGLVTNDVSACVEKCALYAALLTPQGKILFDFFIVPESENHFLIDCATARAADFAKRLSMYRLRAKVDIAPQPQLAVAAAWDDDGAPPQMPAGAITVTDPRLPSLGVRMIASRDVLARAMTGFAHGDYAQHRLRLAVPDSADLPPDTVFALDAGLEELNGVSFKKGCYVGQEVTARMKHRATARRRFVIVESTEGLPDGGTPVESQGREIGTLAGGDANLALALLRLDRLTEAQAAKAPITAAGRKLVVRKADWLDV